MKINKEKYCGLHMSEANRKSLIDTYAGLSSDGVNIREFSRREVAEVYFTETKSNYLLCQSTLDTMDSIKLSNGFFSYLTLPEHEPQTIVVDQDTFFPLLEQRQSCFLCQGMERRRGAEWYEGILL